MRRLEHYVCQNSPCSGGRGYSCTHVPQASNHCRKVQCVHAISGLQIHEITTYPTQDFYGKSVC